MDRIKKLRQENGWLQSDLAEKLHTGKHTISRYETGERTPDLDTILKLCEIFDVSADYLLGRSEQAAPELTEEEYALVAAFRAADEDAQALVLLALKHWLPDAGEGTKKDAAS